MKNSKTVLITWGQDTPAYADQELAVPSDSTPEQIIELAKAKADDVGDLVFDPSYDWTGLRIASITERNNEGGMNYLAEDIPIERSGEDLGLVAHSALNGAAPLSALLHEAERQGVTVAPAVARAIDMSSEVVTSLTNFGRFEIPTCNLVIEAYAIDEYGDSPRCAVIPVTPDLANEMLRLASIGRASKMRAIHVDDDDGIWANADDLRMRGTDMVIMPGFNGLGDTTVFWQAHPKHADYNCETRGFELGDLLTFLAGADAESHDTGFLRQTINDQSVVFYDGNNGGIDDLIEAYMNGDEISEEGSEEAEA